MKISSAQINEMVAVKVMAWHRVQHGRFLDWMDGDQRTGFYERTDGGEVEERNHWNPAEDIACAFQVVEKLRQSGEYCCIDIHSDHNYSWSVSMKLATDGIKHDPIARTSDESLPLAISLAALRAVGEEV